MTKEVNKVVIGIDIGKQNLDVFISGEINTFSVKNDHCGYQRILEKAKYIRLIVVEATSGYERELLSFLWKHNLPVAVVNPRRTYSFAKSKGLLAKTDSLDARMLCEFGQIMNPHPTQP